MNAGDRDKFRDKPTPRAALVEALAGAVRDAAAAGDLDAARVAHEALGRLLEQAEPGPLNVVDLAKRRRG